jgi:hypothetical protein
MGAGMSTPDNAALIALIEPLARRFYGEPNRQRSTKTELRFGRNGSLSVNLEEGTWYSFEENRGGGVLDMVGRETGITEPREQREWLEREGYLTNGRASKANGKANGSASASAKANGKANGSGSGKTNRSGQRREVAWYDYVDAEGKLLFQVVRYEPKSFSQRRPGPNGTWIDNLDGVTRVVYRLPELVEALALDRPVFIVEGEKDADNLWKLGIPATTNPGGAVTGSRPAVRRKLCTNLLMACRPGHRIRHQQRMAKRSVIPGIGHGMVTPTLSMIGNT